MRLLVVEDEGPLREQLQRDLNREGYSTDTAADGDEGWFMAQSYPYDLALIDLGLPGLSGLQLIENIRSAGLSFPILILTARSNWQDKVEGLEAGADDYVVKPFQWPEVIARLNALLRRANGHASNQVVLGPLTLETGIKQVLLQQQALDLTAYEYRILEYLMLNPGKVISKTELTEHIYDQDFDRDSNVIEVLIGRLRRKIDPDNQLKPIKTLRGRGYRLEMEPA